MSCYLTGSNNVCREFAELTSQQLCDQVFRSLDLDSSGSLDFKEYVLAMDLVEARTNTAEDKLELAFRMGV